MPFYRINAPKGTISPAQRAEIAENIVQMHLRIAGGIRMFVNVLFDEYDPERFFVGGAQGTIIQLSAGIRAGRTQEAKTKLLKEYSAMVSRVLGVPESKFLVGVSEGRAENTMEAGHVLPPPGEEEPWLRKVLGDVEAEKELARSAVHTGARGH